MEEAGSERKRQIVARELQEIKEKLCTYVKESTIVTCNPTLVQINIELTEHKKLTIMMQFPADYPDKAILHELKSKTLSEKILNTISTICAQEINNFIGTKQIVPTVRCIRDFLQANPLCVCADEVRYLKHDAIDSNRGDWLKIKQKSGTILMRIQQGNYYMECKFVIPHNYPIDSMATNVISSNLPQPLVKTLTGYCDEIARQCVEKPLKAKPKDPVFVPKPSLKKVADYMIQTCRNYATAICPLCKKRALPDNPSQVIMDAEHNNYVERAYCDHLFHFGCLDTYMKTPPFTDGKHCPACSKRIYHDRWKRSSRVAEERWAHEQAKQRELDEVMDFLQ